MSQRQSIRAGLIAVCLVLLDLPSPAFADEVTVTGVASVIDGDLQMVDSFSIRVHQHAANVK